MCPTSFCLFCLPLIGYCLEYSNRNKDIEELTDEIKASSIILQLSRIDFKYFVNQVANDILP